METPLKIWRRQAGRTVDDVSAELGVTAPMWSRWETGGRRVPAERVLDVERITGVSRYELRPDIYGDAPVAPAEGAAA